MSYEFMEIDEYELSPEEERELLIKAKNGDIEASNVLVTSVYNYTKKLAWYFCRRYEMKNQFEDIFHEGILGVYDAIDKFDLNYNNKFVTYVKSRIMSKLYEFKEKFQSFARIPRNRMIELNKLKQVEKELGNELLRAPTLEELSKKSKYSLEKIKRLLDTDKDALRLEINSGNDICKSETGVKSVSCDYLNLDDGSLDEVEIVEMRNLVCQLIMEPNLTDDEKVVVNWRFGFDREILTQKEIAEKLLSVTRERVQQLENRALFKFQCNKVAQDCASYMDNPDEALQKCIESRNKYLSKRHYYKW